MIALIELPVDSQDVIRILARVAVEPVVWSALFLLAVTAGLVVLRRTRQHKMLSHEAKQWIRQHCRDLGTAGRKTWRHGLYEPTTRSLTILLGVLAALIVLGQFSPLGRVVDLPINRIASSYVFDIVESITVFDVLVVVATGLFALAIFVAESIRDRKHLDRGRVLLKETLLFPIVIVTLGIAVSFFVIIPDSYVGMLGTLFVTALIIRAFYKVIRLLLNPTELAKHRRALLRAKADAAAYSSLQEKTMKGLYTLELRKCASIDYKPSVTLHREGDDRIEIRSNRDGYVIDVNMEILRTVDQWIARRSDSVQDASTPAPTTASQSIPLPSHRSPGSIFVLPHTYVKRSEVLFVYDGRLTPGEHAYLQQTISALLRLDHRREAQFDLRQQLRDLHTEAVEGIRNGDEVAVDNALDVYQDTVNAFQQMLTKCGGGFSPEQARQQRGLFGEGWTSVDIPARDLYHLLEVTAEHGDRRITFSILGLCYSLLRQAVHHHDHYSLDVFLGLQSAMARLSFETSNSSVSEALFGRSWRYLVETLEFEITRHIREAPHEEELNALRSAALAILRTYQEVIKTTIEHDDREKLNLLLTRLERVIDEDAIRVSALDDVNSSLDKARTNTLRAIRIAGYEVVLGLVGFFATQWKPADDTVTNGESRTAPLARLVTALPKSPALLTEVFEATRTYDRQDLWGWDNWEFNELNEGIVRTLDVGSKLQLGFVLGLLSVPPEAFAGSHALIGRDSVTEIERLVELTRDTAQHPFFAKCVPDEVHTRVSTVVQALHNWADEFTRNEQQTIATRAPDQEQIDAFHCNMIKERDRLSSFRGVYRLVGNTRVRTEVLDNQTESIGYSTVYEKQVFFTDWHVSYIGLGEHFGRGLASGENRTLFDSLQSTLATQRTSSSETPVMIPREVSVKTALEETIARELRGGLDLVLLADFGFVSAVKLEESPSFLPSWRVDEDHRFQKVPGFAGLLDVAGKAVPVIRCDDRQDRNALLIEARTMGDLNIVHFDLGEGWEDARNQGGVVLRVRDLNEAHDLRDHFLLTPPEWLQRVAEDERDAFLRRRVVIDVRSKVSIDAQESKGVIIRLAS